MSSSHFYNVQHSPIGAFASFTLGAKGARGGLAMELGKPADQNVYIGLEDLKGGTFSCLPFYEEAVDESTRFDVSANAKPGTSKFKPFADAKISRVLTPGCDSWIAGDLSFSIYTPVCPAPDPDNSTLIAQQLAYVPSIAVEIIVDNRRGRKARRMFFGYQGNDPYSSMQAMESFMPGLTGVACGSRTAIASNTPGVHAALAFTPEEVLAEQRPFNYSWGVGNVGLLVGAVPPGKKKTFRFVVCFHRGGIVTTGMDASYFYARFYKSLAEIATWSLAHFPQLKARGLAFDRRFQRAPLNPARRFMLAQAIHSYYGSTELLLHKERPIWIVNEGEYRMINTFDLTADQVFFEMQMNPWTVANELDWFVQRYSYTDQVRFPGRREKHTGGLSFTHDMGVANHFTPPGRSVYEKAGIHGCFSHMTHEELTNWLMCALIYEGQTRDIAWRKRALPTFISCLRSLLQRDHPDPEKRNGIMSLDSSRCDGGAEITTYDSLDVSLGQARHNLYLAVKNWGVYVGLAAMFKRLGDAKRTSVCQTQAERSAQVISSAKDKHGLLPAVLFENVPSRIIPAMEGLIIPYTLGLHEALHEDGPYGALIRSLKTHLKRVLVSGVCLFPDGGWKLSSTSNNSWLSKVYLCQFIAEDILEIGSVKARQRADNAHASWLLDERNLYWAWSDQMISGEAKGSKYYPRGVTAILWLQKKGRGAGKSYSTDSR